jgi:hypothetical protein
MAKHRPYEVPLDEKLASEILNTPIEHGETGAPRTLQEKIKAAVRMMEEVNVFLSESKMARLIAEMVAKRIKKRGHPSLAVWEDGTLILRVVYDAPPGKEGVGELVRRAARKTRLPTLAELRIRAKNLGLDIADLGRAKRAIFDRVLNAEIALEEEEGTPDNGSSAPVKEGDASSEKDESESLSDFLSSE